MGNFKGHALPGSFFLLFGLWWSVKYPFRYLCQGRKNIYLGSKAGFQRLEFTEGIIKVVFALIGMMAEQFVPDGPHLKLYNNEKKQWNCLMNWQHATMYLFYGISGLVDIVTHSTNVLPEALGRMMLSLAVFVEGELMIGFVLYPPSGSTEWNQVDHNNIMFLTMCYCWHYAITLLIMGVNYTLVSWVVRTKIMQVPSMEIGLLKPTEREHESEDEI
ncbi:hypothetical protein E2320_005287 [Naja naja]|nr:hypothetical protein E2320_005287 [Naja naja]